MPSLLFQESANTVEQLLQAKLDRFEAQKFDNEVIRTAVPSKKDLRYWLWFTLACNIQKSLHIQVHKTVYKQI